MRVVAISAGLILWSALLLADNRTVDFDADVDFLAFKTFTLHEGKVASLRPELNNTLVVKKIGDAIRAQLKAKGLWETADRPDIIVDFSVSGVDYSVGRGGRTNVIGGPSRRGDPNSPPSAAPVRFSEGTLVIDLTRREPKSLVWHGVYLDEEKGPLKLAQKLESDAKKLLSDYPPKKAKTK